MSFDSEVLTLLRAVPHLNVYDGPVPVDAENAVISVAMPYVVYWAAPGYERDIRFGGTSGGRVKDFQLTGVGETREQAEEALSRAYAAINRKRVNGQLIRLQSSAIIRKDDDFTRPGGLPIYYGADQYDVPV